MKALPLSRLCKVNADELKATANVRLLIFFSNFVNNDVRLLEFRKI